MEGSRGSPASRDSAEAQGHPWNSGARQSRTWEPKSDPIRLCQRKGEAEAGTGGGASFSRGRANQQSSGHAAARHLDEVGASDGAECHMEGHLEVEPPEDQVLDSGGL